MRSLRFRASLPTVALIASIACATLSCGEGSNETAGCPVPGDVAASEACVRLELGIPPDAQRVLILSQSSHLDWDWLFTFDYYYRNAVDRVFSKALDLLSAPQEPAAPHYYYSIAEMGFLQRFVEQHPDAVERLRAAGNDLRIVGGGITSPDNLVPVSLSSAPTHSSLASPSCV